MYNCAAITDIGPQFKVNDDRILIGNHILSVGEYQTEATGDNFVLAIADGVGGLQMGYEAAEETLGIVSQLYAPAKERMDIRNCIEAANKSVLAKQLSLNSPQGLRTTLALLYVDRDGGFVANAGDSRVYRFRDNELVQLSKDHSLVQNMVDTGEITEDEAYVHPKRNVITKCIGEEDKVNARIIDLSGDVIINDIYMLCSDGISDCLRPDEIRDTLVEGQEKNLIDLCRTFIHKAIDNGSTDNISICLMRKE